jgi:NAD(P)-dependent dehydrogenase (short-subunit alcohol dehydrogenase family)
MSGFALVTGAARRIGRAIALELAAQGFDIVVHYNRSAEEAETLAEEIIALGRQAVLAEIDLAQADHVAKLVLSLAAELGPLTALVNNASLFEPDQQDPTGALHLAINAEAPRLLSEAFYKQIPADSRGAIVNLLDGMPPENGFIGYNASKQTLKAHTLDMAKRFAPRARVNGIAPGPILANTRQSEKHFQAQIDETPLKTIIAPEDIARATAFLLSSSAVTGEILHVDGGMHLFGTLHNNEPDGF